MLMKKSLYSLAWLLALTLGLTTAHAQPKIATINLEKAFDGYYKTKQASTVLQERGADYEKTYKGYLDDYEKANEEYKKLLDSANDQAVSTDERDRRKKLAEAKLIELRQSEQQIRKFRDDSQDALQKEKLRKRDTILRELTDVVIRKAKAGSFTLVVDTAAKTMNNTPVIIYSTGENDLTEEVLREVNANAPPDLPKSTDSKDDKKDDSKSDKK
jgi:outer membrane protein